MSGFVTADFDKDPDAWLEEYRERYEKYFKQMEAGEEEMMTDEEKPETPLEVYRRIKEENEKKEVKKAVAEAKRDVKAKSVNKITKYFRKLN